MKVLVSDKLAQEGLDILEAAEGIEVINTPGLSEDDPTTSTSTPPVDAASSS